MSFGKECSEKDGKLKEHIISHKMFVEVATRLKVSRRDGIYLPLRHSTKSEFSVGPKHSDGVLDLG